MVIYIENKLEGQADGDLCQEYVFGLYKSQIK